MKVFKDIAAIRDKIRQDKIKGESIGLIPTMGYLHEGHISLIRKAREQNDIVVLSIYVNPTQFGANEDLDKYPRDMERDKSIAKENGVDYIFYPDNEMMYPKGYRTYVEVTGIDSIMCGTSRPIHFKGVATVVTKLFNIIMPDNAYFGQKDAQQAIIIGQMTKDLNIDTKIHVCETVREKDGLAMSSRNAYLTEMERKIAPELYKSLSYGANLFKDRKNKNRSIDEIKKSIRNRLESSGLIKVEYIEIRNGETLEEIRDAEGKEETVLLAAAVKLGKTRLIDNILMGKGS